MHFIKISALAFAGLAAANANPDQNDALQAARQVINARQPVITNAPEARDIIDDIVSTAKAFASTVGDDIEGKASTLLDQGKSIVDDAISDASTFIDGAKSQASTFIEGAKSQVSTALGGAGTYISTKAGAISTAVDDVKGAASSAVDAVSNDDDKDNAAGSFTGAPIAVVMAAVAAGAYLVVA